MAKNPNIIQADTANEALFNALVRHQVYLLQFSGTVKNKIVKLLTDAEEDLGMQIRDRLRNSTGLNSPAELRRLETLSRIITNARQGMWSKIDEVWLEELVSLAQHEPQTFARTLDTVSPTILEVTLPTANSLRAIVTSNPFEGRTLKQWSEKIAQDDIIRILHTIRLGMLNGSTNDEIARSIVGSVSMRGTDGVTEITRRNAQSITRTAINHVASQARNATMLLNKDLISEELFVATLDSRTTPICRATDGKKFPVGEGRIPPLHHGCRSIRVPVLGNTVGDRPMKAVTEQQLLREWKEKNGLDKVPKSRKDLAYGTKTKFDAFASKRTRELTGRVPAETTYQDWLSKQSVQFQNDVLGVNRAALFRAGGLRLDRFVNRNGDEITLHELAQKEAAAFRAAGLDPKDF